MADFGTPKVLRKIYKSLFLKDNKYSVSANNPRLTGLPHIGHGWQCSGHDGLTLKCIHGDAMP
ncbi:hypothetical protein [Alcanivorax hongdengensis]|uniref:hypothetical protein n=1 Tax=Alcanivorax hongdengensis TaxID=519051 RepID=UPI0012F83255|nr:hypothetical protein [Alcanivorax hongdengensis]